MEAKERDRRRATIIALLDHWKDIYEEPSEPPAALVVADVDAKMPDDWSLFSSMQRWPSVVELRRCVDLLEKLGRGSRGKTPVHYSHLMAYTARVEWRLVDTTVKVKNAQNKWIEKPERVRERIVPAWVSVRIVDSALDFLLGLWDRRVALELPPAFGRKLHEYVTESGEHGWTEAA